MRQFHKVDDFFVMYTGENVNSLILNAQSNNVWVFDILNLQYLYSQVHLQNYKIPTQEWAVNKVVSNQEG